MANKQVLSGSNSRTLKMVQIAILCALAIILSTFQVPFVFGLSLNFALVPIVIAAVFVGPIGGCIVGALSGITTAIQTFMIVSAVPLYQVFIGAAPVFTAIMCIAKTALAGLAAGCVFRLLNKSSSQSTSGLTASRSAIKVILPAAITPIVNTGIFCLGVFIVFAKPLAESETFGAVTSGNQIFSFVFLSLVGANFIVELVLNLILCPIIARALFASKKFSK